MQDRSYALQSRFYRFRSVNPDLSGDSKQFVVACSLRVTTSGKSPSTRRGRSIHRLLPLAVSLDLVIKTERSAKPVPLHFSNFTCELIVIPVIINLASAYDYSEKHENPSTISVT